MEYEQVKNMYQRLSVLKMKAEEVLKIVDDLLPMIEHQLSEVTPPNEDDEF